MTVNPSFLAERMKKDFCSGKMAKVEKDE